MADRRDRKARLAARVLISLGLALGAMGLAIIGQPPRPVRAGAAVEAAPKAKLRFSRHAERRLSQRGVTRGDVENLVAQGQPFEYRHAGKLKTGYYDARTGLFVATEGGVVLTVIAGATPDYIARLKKGRGR